MKIVFCIKGTLKSRNTRCIFRTAILCLHIHGATCISFVMSSGQIQQCEIAGSKTLCLLQYEVCYLIAFWVSKLNFE